MTKGIRNTGTMRHRCGRKPRAGHELPRNTKRLMDAACNLFLAGRKLNPKTDTWRTQRTE